MESVQLFGCRAMHCRSGVAGPSASRPGSSACPAAGRGRCATQETTQRWVVRAVFDALGERPGVDGAEQRPARSVHNCDHHLRRARYVKHDPVSLARVVGHLHELARAYRVHRRSVLPRARAALMGWTVSGFWDLGGLAALAGRVSQPQIDPVTRQAIEARPTQVSTSHEAADPGGGRGSPATSAKPVGVVRIDGVAEARGQRSGPGKSTDSVRACG